MLSISDKKGYNRSLYIFSFPPATASFLLQQFSQYGNIQKHMVATDGNWMHVHYQSVLQAKKALSKNGKVFGSTIMVGVTPCFDKVMLLSILSKYKYNVFHTTTKKNGQHTATWSILLLPKKGPNCQH